MRSTTYFVHSDTALDDERWPPCSCGDQYETREQAMQGAPDCLDLAIGEDGIGPKFYTAKVTETGAYVPPLPTCADDLVDHMGDLMADEIADETAEAIYEKVTPQAKEELDTLLAFVWQGWCRKHGIECAGPMLSLSESTMHVLTPEGIK